MEDLDAVAREYKAAKAALEEVRPRLAAAIVDKARGGMRQNEIVRITGLTRERVRQICRAEGFEPGD